MVKWEREKGAEWEEKDNHRVGVESRDGRSESTLNPSAANASRVG